MKFLSVLVILSFGISSYAGDGSSGCGLGWQVAPRKSLVSSFTRAFTNAMTSSTIGMTLGTSGCDQHSIVMNEKKDIHYAEVNFHSLMVEMAKGQGEYVKGFAMVMGCSDAETADFAKSAQKNYNTLFPASGSNPSQLVNSMRNTMSTEGVCRQAAI